MMAALPHEAVDGIVDAIALLCTQLRLGEPIVLLQRTVRDLRHRLAQVLHEYVAATGVAGIDRLEETLQTRLTEVRRLTNDDPSAAVREQVEYCLREVLVCFEFARQVCAQQESVELRQYLLADLPLLRPFDYGVHKETMATV